VNAAPAALFRKSTDPEETPLMGGKAKKNMKSLRRLIALLAVVTTFATAADWPHRPVKILVGGAPGSAPDRLARLMSERLTLNLGQTVIVENRHGASGQIAMDALVRSPADGYTLAIATMSQAVFNSYMFPKLAYDPLRDFAPIGTLATGAFAIAVHPAVPIDTFAELVAHARAQPNELFVATPGNGSPPHIAYLMLQKEAGFELSTVPFRGGPDATNAVVGGQVPILMAGPTLIASHVAAGKLRALLVTGERREPTLPGVPTAGESGIRFQAEAWLGLVAPAHTPSQVVERIHRETVQILASSEVDAQIRNLGLRVLPSSPAAFARQIRDDHARWGTTIRKLGLKPDS